MAFDNELAARIREHLEGQTGLTEMKMFGGLAFLIHGNICCGVYGAEMLVRVDPAQMDEILRLPNTRMFDLSPRPMKGWILVRGEALASRAGLSEWLEVGLAYAAGLPPK